MVDLPFFSDKTVLVTGHTGFKGSWLCHLLAKTGAQVHGYALDAPTEPSLFKIAHLEDRMDSVIGDVRDLDRVCDVVRRSRPDIVLHLAAQPIVLDGYRNPHYTYETNVMGTVNILEAIRRIDCVRSCVNVTTDKVYRNEERFDYGYVEEDQLDGYDPYSNSKSCSELVTHSYAKSFLADAGVATSTARAGNVIGGGDFAPDRIVPDCVRAVDAGEPLRIRNPFSTRPYQHVLEPLFAYLMIAQRQYDDVSLASSYNVGPDECDCITTGGLVSLFERAWGDGFTWVNEAQTEDVPHEATFLKLDSSKLKRTFGWTPRWHIADAVEATVEWTRAYAEGGDVCVVMDAQIDRYTKGIL